MKYLKVKWKHNLKKEPIWLYSELNNTREELRKIEIFPNGKYGYANTIKSKGTTRLSETKIPTLKTISKDSQFKINKINYIEFEKIWSKVTG